MPTIDRRFVKYCVVGVSNTLIHMITLLVLVEQMKFSAPASNAVAFFVANLWSFFLNAAFTFKARFSVLNYVRFLVVSLIGLAVNFIVVWLGVRYGVNYLLGALASIGVVTLIGYLGSKRYVFRSAK